MAFRRAIIERLMKPLPGSKEIVISCLNNPKESKPLEFGFAEKSDDNWWWVDAPVSLKTTFDEILHARPNEYHDEDDVPPGAGTDLKEGEEAPCIIGTNFLGKSVAVLSYADRFLLVFNNEVFAFCPASKRGL